MMDSPKRKLLLIMPPQQGLLNGFASGLISLANYVEARMPGLDASIIDMSVDSSGSVETEIVHTLTESQETTHFVGITATTASYQSALQVARLVKRTDPQSVVILGGHHASADPEIILRHHKGIVDFIIAGEGERSLYELLRNYPALEAVSGLCFLDAEGQFIRNESHNLLSQEELDAIPITYGDNGLIGTPGKFGHATYVSARGCPLGCAFCAVGKDTIRAKSIPAVIRDIELLLDIGFCRIAIEDNFFAHSPSRTHDLCEALADVKRRRIGAFSWDCQTRVESLARKDTVNLLARAGCEAVYIGVESIHPEQLLYLNKTTNPSKYLTTLIEEVVPSLLNTDIEIFLNLQFGLPGETEIHERATRTLLEQLGHLAASHGKTITIFPQLHVVYPGTTHFHQGVLQGRFPRDIFEAFTKWEFRQMPVLYWLGEHFAHGTGGIPEGILKPELLRDGRFEDVGEVVDTNAILRISAMLRAIDRIRGVHTFNYGDYIVTDAQSQDNFLAENFVAKNVNVKGVSR